MLTTFRSPCPPGSCICGRENLPDLSSEHWRILRLNREEEKTLLRRLENITSLADLEYMQQRLYDQLGIRLHISLPASEVRSARGLEFQIAELVGLCRKTRKAIPAAIRRALDERPHIIYELLNAHDLLRDA